MHRRIAILVVLCGFVVFAQKPGWLPPAGHPTMPLWANGAPDNPPSAGPEADVTTAKDNLIAGKPLIRLGNVSNPTLTLYTPRNNSGAAVVVFRAAAIGSWPSTWRGPRCANGSIPPASPAPW